MVMVQNKKTTTQHDNATRQDFENPQHFLISSTNSNEDYKSGRDKVEKEYDNDLIYQYNLDDFQG